MKTEMPLVPRSGGGRFASLLLALLALAGQMTLNGQITVDTLGGGRTNFNGLDYGFANGSTFSNAQFNAPGGIAFDVSGRYLYVADTTNNAVRRLDTIAGLTTTPVIVTNAQPVDVATDRSTNLYVLTRADGLIRTYNRLHVLTATNNLTALTNPTAMALDANGNFYVTELGGAVRFVSTNGTVSTVAGITNLLAPQGVEVMDNGLVAISDSGNHVIRLYNPGSSNYAIFAGQFGTNGTNNGNTTNAQFNLPRHIAKAGDNVIVVADYGNHQVKKIDAAGNVSLLYGSLPWFTLTTIGLRDEDYGILPGFADGAGGDDGIAESRQPSGVLVDGSGNVFVTEQYYHVIRKVTGTGLSGPSGTSTGGGTQLPPVAAPTIGLAVHNEVSGQWNFVPLTNSSVLSPATFYTNAVVVITSPESIGVQTLYTVGGATDSVFNAMAPTPSSVVGQPIPFYQTNQYSQPISVIAGQIQPFLILRAISVQTGRTNSPVVEAVFNFKTPPPVIVTSNNNAASFTLTNTALNALIYYSTDGSDPTNGGPFTFNSASPTLGFNLETTNMLFKARAFVPNYEASVVVSNLFTTNTFVANKISFGFENGEASSDFVAAPGSKFMAPVTLQLIPGQPIYGMQFALLATNDPGSPPVSLGAGSLSFESMLMKKIKGILYQIPPAYFLYTTMVTQVVAGATQSVSVGVYTNTALLDTNLGFNVLGVGWWERSKHSITPADDDLRLYNPLAQTLVTYSQAHDTTFPTGQNPGGVIVGGFRIQIPSNALPGQTYTIRIERPSASPDGINEDVFIQAPVSTSLPNTGSLKAMRTITIGSRSYTVGDVVPFRWFNAGDFGDTPTNRIKVNDVIQVFQTVVYNLNIPPSGSDYFDAFDSANSGLPGLLTSNVTKATIDAMKYGDTNLDVNDIFVTYQRSLFSDLNWYQRYWTNIGGVSTQVVVTVPNIGPIGDRPARQLAAIPASTSVQSDESPHVRFTAEDALAVAGQTIQVPIRARIKGGLPIKIMMENFTVEPLDGAPDISQSVALTPAVGLGAPYGGTVSQGSGNVAAVFLDNTVSGVSGTNLICTLTVTLPTNIPPGAAYAVRFDRISASPNGLGIFPQTVEHGLITFGGSRTNSSWNDGIPDSWRLRHFGTISNYLSAATADADGDGVPNWAEYRAGTSPLDSASNLRLLSAQAAVNGANPPSSLTLTVPTVDGMGYVLEYCSSLFGTNWTAVTNFTGTGVNVRLQDSSNTGGEPRFYRVRLQE